jgi:hypothetical protein
VKHKKKYQLFKQVNSFESALNFIEDAGNFELSMQSKKKMAFVRWPSGKPCEAVNMYLLDCYEKWTGDTVIREAAKLSELVRYCASHKILFSDVKDKDIASLIHFLLDEPCANNFYKKVRNNNSIRKIMQSCFVFLSWFQRNLHFNPIPLIGSKREGAAIIIEHRKNNRDNTTYLHHRYLPPEDCPAPKLPIATEMIEQTEAIVDSLYYPDAYNEYARRRFSKDVLLFRAHRDYITARREFMILILRRTGLRPGEMHLMSVHKNYNSLRDPSPFLLLPTLKQRKLNPPLRKFYITRNDAPRFLIYFKARSDWFNFSKSRNPSIEENDAMFLSTESGNLGMPISKSGIEKDFGRLCNLAGFSDQQICFSMFRHRFITELVLFHLKELGLQRQGTANADFRVVLEKVRERTGHRSIDSLWVYINFAYDFDGIFSAVEQAILRINSAEELSHDLILLRREIQEGNMVEQSGIEVCDKVIDRISTIIYRAKNVILT